MNVHSGIIMPNFVRATVDSSLARRRGSHVCGEASLGRTASMHSMTRAITFLLSGGTYSVAKRGVFISGNAV